MYYVYVIMYYVISTIRKKNYFQGALQLDLGY